MTHYENSAKAGWVQKQGYTEKRGLVLDIHVPRELWTKFEEFPPLFYNSYIPSKAIATHMKEYLQ